MAQRGYGAATILKLGDLAMAAPDAQEPVGVKPSDIVALYDTVLFHIAKAGEAGLAGDGAAQLEQILAANRILSGLDESLDLAAGGQVAANLHDMYQSVIQALQGSVGDKAAAEVYAALVPSLRNIRNAWAGIA